VTYDETDHPGGPGPDAPFDPDVWSDEPAPGPRRPPRPGPDDRGAARPPRRSRQGGPPAAPPRRPRRREEEYFDLPHESRFPRWLVALAVLILVIGAVVGGSMWWYHNQVDPPGAAGEQVQVQIPEGSTTSDVGSILDDQGVISSATLFGFYVGGKDLTSVQAGTYTFQADSSFDEAIKVLNAGPGKAVSKATTKVSIPEGYTVNQIIARIHEKVPRISEADLRAALDEGKVPSSLKPESATSYEGLLFPATYEVGSSDTAVDVLTAMAAEMETRVNALGLSEAQAHIKERWGLDLTAYDLLKVASMIQYEAAVPEDAPKIGAVTYNRMEKGTPLGFDSTLIYEAGLSGIAPNDVDHESDSAYNTRVHEGLPPTPISAPGEYALEGAMRPADGDWIYFVLTDPKIVSFTADYNEFLEFKAICKQKDLGCG
jgi:UPF0755 protein